MLSTVLRTSQSSSKSCRSKIEMAVQLQIICIMMKTKCMHSDYISDGLDTERE